MDNDISFNFFFNDMVVCDNDIHAELFCPFQCIMCLDTIIDCNDQGIAPLMYHFNGMDGKPIAFL